MSNSKLDAVRNSVRAEFSRLGCREQDRISEAILLSKATYFGHRFQYGKYSAVWKIKADTIDFFVEDQQIKSVSLSKSDSPNRHRAA